MFDHAFEFDPRPTPLDRDADPMHDGHRPKYDDREDRESASFRERCDGTLTDVGVYA